jgi:hypothetical protein
VCSKILQLVVAGGMRTDMMVKSREEGVCAEPLRDMDFDVTAEDGFTVSTNVRIGTVDSLVRWASCYWF